MVDIYSIKVDYHVDDHKISTIHFLDIKKNTLMDTLTFGLKVTIRISLNPLKLS